MTDIKVSIEGLDGHPTPILIVFPNMPDGALREITSGRVGDSSAGRELGLLIGDAIDDYYESHPVLA